MQTIKPYKRYLKGYAFDPSLSLQIDTLSINEIQYAVDWDDYEAPGPKGKYVEVIDYDPTIDTGNSSDDNPDGLKGVFYDPIDLDDPHILATNGLKPSPSNPQYHQQMVYAVAMTTIKNFENALGRKIIWSDRVVFDKKHHDPEFNRKDYTDQYVPRLRIYPHALRASNAYYSPSKKALLFGYFNSYPKNSSLHMPGSLVFTCLSHDIIAHEVTHAILDSIHSRYNEPTNPDVLAFHEAFADIIALFQHFTFSDTLKHQIAKTRGDLQSQNLLAQLAQEFGSAIGSYGSLRNALGHTNEKNEWIPKTPNPSDYLNSTNPHDRGSILVAAVFEAFLAIYKERSRDLLRIATNGTGVLPKGEIHPDLVNRLSIEAAKSAKHVLNMCIRAIDFCPPVDLTFGEYLRAIITADYDLVREDSRDYRLAFIDAFRRRGIYPEGIKTLSVDSLRYAVPEFKEPITHKIINILNEFLQSFRNEVGWISDREDIYYRTREYIAGNDKEPGLHNRLKIKMTQSQEFEKLTGLLFTARGDGLGIRTNQQTNMPRFAIENLNIVTRVGPSGQISELISITIVQTARFNISESDSVDKIQMTHAGTKKFRSGCTLIFDLHQMKLLYVIKNSLLKVGEDGAYIDIAKIEERLAYMTEVTDNAISNQLGMHNFNDPFSLLHQH